MSTIRKSKLPPGPKVKIPLSNFFSFRRDSIGFLRKVANEFGDIVYFRIGPTRIVLLNHPDLIKEVLSTHHKNFIKGRPLEMAKKLLGEGLLTSEGEYHKHHSRVIQPAFHRKMIESYSEAMTYCAYRTMNSWKEGLQVDIMEEMMKMSTAIAARAMFKADVEEEAPEIVHALKAAAKLFERISVPFSEWLLKLPLPSTRRFYRAKALLDKTIETMIDKRRRNKLDNGDLISLLINSQEEKDESIVMSDQEIRDEALTLFLTAFDTTSTALTWTWYLLSQYSAVESELHEEIDRELQGRIPTAEDIPRLRFTRMVFAESLRMFPPSYIIPRQAVEDFPIDKYIVPAGTLVLMSPYLIHHDSRFHSNPEQFNPHTWDNQSKSQQSKYAYFPFSAGPRSCVGESFAWMEGVLVLATIAQAWRLKLVPHHRVQLLQLINLRPKYGMLMTLHARR